MKAILFDFDGVLHNTFDLHRGKIAEFAGLENLSEEAYRDMHDGNFFKHSISGLENVDWLAYRDFVREHVEILVMEEAVRETLEKLGENSDLFIVSSGGESVISKFLENNGVRNLFGEILGAEFHRSKVEKFRHLFQKYDLNNENSIFVTDTLGDILEANEFGIQTIAVDFGFHPRETLEKGNPHMIISDFRDLLTCI